MRLFGNFKKPGHQCASLVIINQKWFSIVFLAAANQSISDWMSLPLFLAAIYISDFSLSFAALWLYPYLKKFPTSFLKQGIDLHHSDLTKIQKKSKQISACSFFGFLSNQIGEDQFPASKMKWGIFLGTDTVKAPQKKDWNYWYNLCSC